MNVNLNSSAAVKLKPKGLEILRAYWNTTATCARCGPQAEIPGLREADMEYHSQLWEICAIFGPHFFDGCDNPIDIIIAIEPDLNGPPVSFTDSPKYVRAK